VRSLSLLAAAGIALSACADPIDLPDAGPDSGPQPEAGPRDADPQDSGDARDVGIDAGDEADSGTETDAGVHPDAEIPDSGGITCTPNGRQHYMLGSAQNPQTVTFGAGLATERTVDLDGAYLASFDSGGCFEWLARIPSDQTSFGGVKLITDAAGNIYIPVDLLAMTTFHNADDSVAWSVTSTSAGGNAETYTRGVAVVSYDKDGQFRWGKRIGNAAVQPEAKGYAVESIELVNGTLRIAVSVNGSTRGSAENYEIIAGRGEPNETRISIGRRYQFGFTAALSADTGALVADSLRINRPQLDGTAYSLRHNGRGAMQPAQDGSTALGLLYVGNPASYDLNWGRMDQTTVQVSQRFVAGFLRYTSAGDVAWHRFAGATTGGMSLFASAMLADGSTLFTGSSSANADFEGSAGVSNLPKGATGYLVRYTASGDIAWLRGIAGRGLSALHVDESRQALFAHGIGSDSLTFGVGDSDAVTEMVDGMFIARFNLQTGALEWISKVDTATGSFRGITIIGDELIVSTRFDNLATFEPGDPNEAVIRASTIWSGHAVYDVNDGAFGGVLPYIEHRGTPRNDGLNIGAVYQP